MDIEQLKLILETIKGLSGDATTVAIWYFVVNYGLSLLQTLVWVGAISYIVGRIVSGLNFETAMKNETHQAMVQLGEVIGKGPVMKHSYLGDFKGFDYEPMLKVLREKVK